VDVAAHTRISSDRPDSNANVSAKRHLSLTANVVTGEGCTNGHAFFKMQNVFSPGFLMQKLRQRPGTNREIQLGVEDEHEIRQFGSPLKSHAHPSGANGARSRP
jgi:hypothetical protein